MHLWNQSIFVIKILIKYITFFNLGKLIGWGAPWSSVAHGRLVSYNFGDIFVIYFIPGKFSKMMIFIRNFTTDFNLLYVYLFACSRAISRISTSIHGMPLSNSSICICFEKYRRDIIWTRRPGPHFMWYLAIPEPPSLSITLQLPRLAEVLARITSVLVTVRDINV